MRVIEWNTRPIEDAQAARIAELEEALIKASVRADFFGDSMNNLDITSDADVEASQPLYDEVENILDSIHDEKARYQAHYDAALARWKKENAEDSEG